MPKTLERKLKKTAKKRGYGKKRTSAYVYVTMNKLGAMYGNVKVGTRNVRNWG